MPLIIHPLHEALGLNNDAKRDRDNRSVQLNPNNDAYWQAQGLLKRPADWKARIAAEKQRRPSR